MLLPCTVLSFASFALLLLTACDWNQKNATDSAEISPSLSQLIASPAYQDQSTPTGHEGSKPHRHEKDQLHRHGATSEHRHEGGQVPKMGPYHLELFIEKQTNGVYLNVDLLKGEAHTPVADATVEAQLQLPDGTKQAVRLKFEPSSKHYTALLPSAALEEYKIAILTNIAGVLYSHDFGR